MMTTETQGWANTQGKGKNTELMADSFNKHWATNLEGLWQ